MNTSNHITIFKNADALSEAACKFIIDTAKRSIEERGKFVIALSGGRTPEKLFDLLAQPEFEQQMDWTRTFLFWGDERCVATNDKRNNFYAAKFTLLNKIVVPVLNVHPIPVDLSPVNAAFAYEKTIKQFFGEEEQRFDLILLGLGENGHTASLFPMTDVLHEQEHLVKEVYVEEQDLFRVTMTAPLINQARNILFLVTGKEKADVLHSIFTLPHQPDTYPAQLIQPTDGKLYWYADEAAAARVTD